MTLRPSIAALAVALVATACSGASAAATAPAAAVSSPLADSECRGRFVAHELDHVTAGPNKNTTMFDGMGAGVGVADFDGDGQLDIALANLAGQSHVFLNQGALRFERRELVQGRFREVAAVDVDGDGWVDLVLSTGVGVPVYLRNVGGDFVAGSLEGIAQATYAMAWDDLGGDGDLDFVTGSYNAELTADRDFAAVLGGRSGVFVHEAKEDGFETQELNSNAQALAVLLEDLNGDGSTDILVGNDLITPDGAWVAQGDEWQPVELFTQTTFSTMSLDAGDFDNDGDVDLFATDMHPMSEDPDVLEAWEPIFEDMEAQQTPEGDPQAMANVLQIAEGDYRNRAEDLGVAATGWSWSGLFGDLDNDGFSDVYVVNGMTADALFPDLPDYSLVEENQAFRNIDGERLVPAPEWGLGATTGGRGVVQADLDGDGDLDIVVNNLNAPATVYENRVCGGEAITVELRWPDSRNPFALGSTVIASVDGATMRRSVRSARGYLSSAPPRLHFGLGEAAGAQLTITWPDGAQSLVGDVDAGMHVVVTRDGG